MKITIEVDMTPQEARDFLGLPNVERIQEQLVTNAEKYLSAGGEGQYEEMISSAMQPMLAYHQWLQRLMTDTTPSKTGKGRSDR